MLYVYTPVAEYRSGTYVAIDGGVDLLRTGVQQVRQTDHRAAQFVAAAVQELQQHVRTQLWGCTARHLVGVGGVVDQATAGGAHWAGGTVRTLQGKPLTT